MKHCALLGILPTYVIPKIDRAYPPLVHENATAALIPLFFKLDAQRRENIAPKFLTEFHDLGAQVGQSMLPSRGLVVLHRGGKQNPVVFAMSTSYMLITLTGILAFSFVVFRILPWCAVARSEVWDGALRRLLPTMTYTATGLPKLVRVIFDNILNPRVGEDRVEAVARHILTAIVRNHTTIHIVVAGF